jgi:two-component system sensor histidine kinase KdpD
VERDSSLLIAAVGAGAAIAVAGLLVSIRDWLGASNVALVLAVVIVAAATFGGRLAGVLTSIAAAFAFDFFHTDPLYNLRISDREDIITALLLLVVGIIVGELSMLRAASRREVLLHAQGASRLEDVASVVAAGADLDEVWPVVRRALTEQLRLAGCRFEPAPARQPITTLERSGQIASRELHWVHGGGFALPPEGVAVPVVTEGRTLGRLVLVPRSGTGTTKAQRRVAVALADQLAVAAARTHPLHPLS